MSARVGGVSGVGGEAAPRGEPRHDEARHRKPRSRKPRSRKPRSRKPRRREPGRGEPGRGEPRLTLGEYVRRRNGVPIGAAGALRNMLHRAFGAGSFAGFWRYWNPVFGYGLGRYVNWPLRKMMPPTLALIATFVVCGALHDLVTMAVRGSVAFLFTPWFLFHGVGVVLGNAIGMDLSRTPWLLRASVNLAYILVCLTLAFVVRSYLGP